MAEEEPDFVLAIRAALPSLLEKSGRGGAGAPRVFKEECAFSFDTPRCIDGLYVSLLSFQGFGRGFVEADSAKTGCKLYLHILEREVGASTDAAEQQKQKQKGDSIAVSSDGGLSFKEKEIKFEKKYSLVVLPEFTSVPLPDARVPLMATDLAETIINSAGANTQASIGEWQQEIKVSKYAENLKQLSYDEHGALIDNADADESDAGTKRITTNAKHVSPDASTWRCEESGEKDNLWLNLSTGFIGSGRRHYDGSGGNGAALRHFEATGSKYPLVVKLGTITPHGADVYSYAKDEDDLVKDPLLAEHLAHWGIDVMRMKKTEKTMAELQVELNQKFEFDRITEAGAELVSLSGPGLIGLQNLGNSCYINSIVQVLYSLPEMHGRYLNNATALFESAPKVPQDDLLTQLARLGVGMCAPPPASAPSENGKDAGAGASVSPRDAYVAPRTFRSLVGRGHPEFSTAHQQDTLEYFDHLMELIVRAEHAGKTNKRLGEDCTSLAALFRYEVESRIQVGDSGKVMYKSNQDSALRLEIPIAAAVNGDAVSAYEEREAKRQRLKEENAVAYIGDGSVVGNGASTDKLAAHGNGGSNGDAVTVGKEEPVIPRVPFDACLAQFGEEEVIDGYMSPTTGALTTAMKRVRMKTFPPYLVVQMRRYFVASDWSAKKMNVLVDVPESFDMSSMRGSGPAAGEDVLDEAEALEAERRVQEASQREQQQQQNQQADAAAAAVPNAGIVEQLMGMGFSENASKRAALATGNSSAEASMEWVFAHMGDSDFNDPLPPASTPGAGGTGTGGGSAAPSSANAESVQMLCAMGFSEKHAEAALTACNGSLERAADWLFSHADNLDAACDEAMGAGRGGTGGTDGGDASASGGDAPRVFDGEGKYTLFAIVSHIGSNTNSGHYVAHIRKDGRWVLFNDEKVAASSSPPLDLGYIYFFKRDDWDASAFQA